MTEDEYDAALASGDEREARKSEKLWALMSSYIGSGEAVSGNAWGWAWL